MSLATYFFQGLYHSFHGRKESAGVALATYFLTVTMIGGIGRNGPGNLLSEGNHGNYPGRDSGPGYLLSQGPHHN